MSYFRDFHAEPDERIDRKVAVWHSGKTRRIPQIDLTTSLNTVR
jgi:hypothetical protein